MRFTPNSTPHFGFIFCRYVGEYSKDVKHGKGREVLPNGQYYDGSYQEGVYHGVGEFAEEDGSLYSGTWHLGVRQGQGSQANNRERHEYTGSFMSDMCAMPPPPAPTPPQHCIE